MRYRVLIWLILPFCSCGPSPDQGSPFSFTESEHGVTLSEGGNTVFFYQKEPKVLDGRYICNDYLHPVLTPWGDTLTEESPPDHPYHRGIFWSWHQHYINGRSMGDGWIMENISREVVKLKTKTDKNTAKLDVTVLWKSPNHENGSAYIQENTSILTHRLKSGIRMMDFEICLLALVPGVSLGGSDDEKGYGGLCTRIKMPDDLIFTSTAGRVTPETLQITAGPWMDFSGTFGSQGSQYGLAILCHPGTPNYPAPWILRQKSSMQNIVFPGRDPVDIPTDQPVKLKYRLILHEGDADAVDLDLLQSEYAETAF
jgi:hypothetical protein